MKYNLVLMLSLISTVAVATTTAVIKNKAEGKVEINDSTAFKISSLVTLKQKYSYGMGVNTQKRFDENAVPVDTKLFIQSMSDFRNGDKLLLTNSDIAATVEKLTLLLKNGNGINLDNSDNKLSKNESLSTFKQQYSYSMGISASKKLAEQGIVLDFNAFELGMRHVQGKLPTLLNDNEISQSIKEIKAYLAKEKTDALHKLAFENELESSSFFVENRSKEGIVETSTGLQYKILKANESGQKPSVNDMVKVHYRGYLIDGTEFDNSYKRGVATQVELKSMIPGWKEGVKMMTAGSKWQFFIPPELAYGVAGNGGIIGPNTTLIFEIELLEVVKPSVLTPLKTK